MSYRDPEQFVEMCRRELKRYPRTRIDNDPAQIIDAGCVLVERQVAKDLDLSAIFRMDPEQILKALELECV